MQHTLLFTASAEKDLTNLEGKVAARIKSKLTFFISSGDPMRYAKKLVGGHGYRFRVGRYKIIFDTDSRGNIIILVILRIKHRKDVY